MFHLSHVFCEITKLEVLRLMAARPFHRSYSRLKQEDQVQSLLGLKSEFIVSLGSFLRPCLKMKIFRKCWVAQ